MHRAGHCAALKRPLCVVKIAARRVLTKKSGRDDGSVVRGGQKITAVIALLHREREIGGVERKRKESWNFPRGEINRWHPRRFTEIARGDCVAQ